MSTKEILLDNILAFFADKKFTKNQAVKIVGGETRLYNLIAEGKIEATKANDLQNGRWAVNAAQVLENCKQSINTNPNRYEFI